MFVDFPRIDGPTVSIAPSTFVVASIPLGHEPRDAISIRYNGGTLFTSDGLGTVIAKLVNLVPLIQLTDPRPSIIWLNAEAVSAITPRIEWRDRPDSKSSILLGGRLHAVMESPSAVKAAIGHVLPNRFLLW